jgi:diacylglycerol kinase (ATP)
MLRTRLAPHVDLEISTVSSSAEATRAARAAAEMADIVVAVGGDGTVADVATGILGTPAALGIVPAGSTNITARSLGIPARKQAAIALLVGDHRYRWIDVGRGGDRVFLHMAGAGVDAELFKAASADLKRRLGWLAYLPAATTAIQLAPVQVSITADGQVFEAESSLVLVANGAAVLTPTLTIHPEIAVDDGWLDLLVFTPATPIEIAATLGYAGMRRLDLSPHVLWRRAQHVRIDAEPPLAVQLDGDPRGLTPREFGIVPRGMRLVAPLGDP